MKRISVITAILIMGATQISSACDMCNCYLGLDPGYNKNTIGLRTNFRYATYPIPVNGSMKLMHGGDHSSSGTSGTKELSAYFWGTDLYARIYPVKKLQVIAALPFQVNTLMFDTLEESRSALSDLTILAMYQVANTMPSDSLSVRHRVFAGGGIKLPSGKSSGAADVNIPMSHHLYSGTGSTDYLLMIAYIGKYRKIGWNTEVSFKLNGESKNEYRYGHTFNITPRLFYEVSIGSAKLLPHAGAAFESGMKDQYKGEDVDETGGSVLWGNAGADLYFGKFSLTTDVRIPVTGNLGETYLEDQFWLFSSINFHF